MQAQNLEKKLQRDPTVRKPRTLKNSCRGTQVLVLPSSFQDSMQEYDQDAMAIAAQCAKPDARPASQIAALPPNQKTMTRVFKMHLKELLHDIKVSQCVYALKFQNCGLPHCHLTIFLIDGSKHRVPADIDKIIHAEIPTQQKNMICITY